MLTLGIVRTSSALPSLNRIFLAEGDSNPYARRFISGVITNKRKANASRLLTLDSCLLTKLG